MTSILPQGRARQMARPEVEELAQSLQVLQARAVQAGIKRSSASASIAGWGTWAQSLGVHKKYLAGSEILHEPLSELVTSAVRRFIDSTDETPASSEDDTSASHKTYVLYEPSNQRKAQVFRFVPGEDILLSLKGGVYVSSGRHLVEQGFADLGHGRVVSWRSFESQTLNDRIHSMDDGVPTPHAFKQRLAILQRILAGLEELQDNGQVHGDLRPTNIAFPKAGEVRLLDYATRPTLSILSQEQRTYLAPEADEKPTPASDMYSFGKIAQRLVGNYLWSDRYTPANVDNSAFAWILELCTQKEPSVRPTVAQIRETLFARVRNKKAHTAAVDADSIPNKDYLYSLQIERVDDEGMDPLNLADYPETSLALAHPQVLSNLHSLVKLDTPEFDAHNRAQEVPQEGQSLNEIERGPQNFPKHIDEQMKDGIHRLHFGVGLSPAHDEKLPRIKHRSRLAARQADYHSHLRQADAARTRLLASDQYLYSFDVAAVLGFGDDDARLATVALLRRWGNLVAVKDHERWLHPAFQFHPETGALSPYIRGANQVMMEGDPWGNLSWWFFPRVSLGGAALASVIHDPEYSEDIRLAIDRLKR